jgi:hypothetical protein
MKLLDINLDRSCHTKHGFHLNTTEKERVTEMRINQLQIFTIKDKENVTAQNWVQHLDE